MENLELESCDVVIAGGGMVGLTLGIALAQSGVETIVIDGADPALLQDEAFDGRVSSFAPASRRMLEVLSVWSHVHPHAEPVLDIVVGDGTVRAGASTAMLHFDHREIGADPLAHMVENRHFRKALDHGARACSLLQVLAPCRVVGTRVEGSQIVVSTNDGRAVRARLCVAADGCSAASAYGASGAASHCAQLVPLGSGRPQGRQRVWVPGARPSLNTSTLVARQW
jgi:2-octaprenyl-6-methoxyphenol hydroxylase